MASNEKDYPFISISELKPYPNNARQHPAEQIDKIVNSINEFGFITPVIIDENNMILVGHGRTEAAKIAGLDKVPFRRVTNLSDDQKRAYILADNKLSDLAEWDEGLLMEELEKIDLDMSAFGFDDFEIDIDGDAGGVEEDETPEPPEEPRAQLGDLYKLGKHRIICGDSTDVEVVDKLMDGQKADMVFTDPPYNIASDSTNFTKNSNSPHMRELANTEWDKNFNISEALDNILIALSENATVYICTSHFLAGKIWQWMDEWAKHVQYCVWSKPNPMPSLSKRHWTWNTELICYATRGKHTFNFPKEGHALSTWTINKKNGDTGHPTEKPVEVPTMAISHSSKKGDVVLDLFGGSGSTLMVCEQLGRTCYMCELDRRYVDVIIERWENFTGKKAEKIGG